MSITSSEYQVKIIDMVDEALDEYAVDFSQLNINRDDAIRLATLGVLDMVESIGEPSDLIDTLVTTICALVVENTVLNIRLEKLKL